MLLEVKEHCSFADFFIICSGASKRQVAALAETQYQRTSDKVTVIYLLDQSLSIPEPRRLEMLHGDAHPGNFMLMPDGRMGVIDFGAGHSVYEDEALLTQVKCLLAPYPNVILVLPSAVLSTSLKVLRNRRPSLVDTEPDINMHFITHASNYELAKFIVYTADRTPEASCAEILHLVTAGRDRTP